MIFRAVVLLIALAFVASAADVSTLERAARRGDVGTMIDLAGMYYHGDGVPKHAQRAYIWGTIFMNSVPDYTRGIAKLTGFAENELSPAQLRAANAEIQRLMLNKGARDASAGAPPKQSGSEQLRVDPLGPSEKKPIDVFHVWFSKNTSIENPEIMAQEDGSGFLLVSVNGKLERLPIQSGKNGWSSGYRPIGSKRTQVWANQRVRVTITSTLRKAGNGEHFYSADMEVFSSGKVRRIAVNGYWGA